MALYEVVVLELPKKEEDSDRELEKIVLTPQIIVANDAQSAAIAVAMENVELLKTLDRARMQVLVRPF